MSEGRRVLGPGLRPSKQGAPAERRRRRRALWSRPPRGLRRSWRAHVGGAFDLPRLRCRQRGPSNNAGSPPEHCCRRGRSRPQATCRVANRSRASREAQMSTPRPSLLVAAAAAIVLSIKRGGLPGQPAGTSGPSAWTYFAYSRRRRTERKMRAIPPVRFSASKRLCTKPQAWFYF